MSALKGMKSYGRFHTCALLNAVYAGVRRGFVFLPSYC